MFRHAWVLLFLLFFTSCGILYVPGKLNTPFFNDQKQVTLTGATTGSALTAQAGYSISKHIAVIGSYFQSEKEKDTSTTSKYFSRGGELGIGYYRNLPHNLLWDIYIGAGLGEVKTQDLILNTQYFSESSFNKIFLQSSIGYHSKYFISGLTIKLNRTNIKYQTNYSIELPNPFSFYDAEIALTALLGMKPVYANLQVGYIIAGKRYSEIYFPFILNVGITFKF